MTHETFNTHWSQYSFHRSTYLAYLKLPDYMSAITTLTQIEDNARP